MRDRSKLMMEFKQLIGRLKHTKIYLKFSEDYVFFVVLFNFYLDNIFFSYRS